MSRDPSGNYSLPQTGATGNIINPVQPATIITTDWANTTLNDVALALTNSLDRNGKGGMSANLVMNGYKITGVGPATLAADVPQAIQVRDQTFIWLTSVLSNQSGNDYVGTAVLKDPPANGVMYQFLADRANTGAMTLAVNGAAPLPILLHGSPVPAGLILAGAVIPVVYVNLTYRLISIAPGTGTVNSVQSADPALISVTNDFTTNIATLIPHSNVALGMVKLDGSTKVPVVQLPFTDIHYIGIWDASAGTLPSASGVVNGGFYIVTVAGTLALFRVAAPGSNVYTSQSTPVVVGDALIRRVGSVDANQPDGWYFDPGAARPAVAGTVSMNPTPSLPAVTDAQTWMFQMDGIIASKLPLAGGTMSGPILSPAVPAAANELVNKQYVDGRVAAIGGVTSFNSRQGAVTLINTDVSNALGYVPVNPNNAAFTNNILVTGSGTFSEGVAAKYFIPTFDPSTPPVSGAITLNFINGQSQRIQLVGNTTITNISNIPPGSILRLGIDMNFGGGGPYLLTWPATVVWPMGIPPDLASGPLKRAIVVMEAGVAGGTLYATASIY